MLDLVEAKMEVLSTVNVQHLESIAPTVGAITGIKIRETVPDWVLEHANEIVMVDLTPEALQNRMKRGEVYHTGKVDQALKNFFRRGNLIALRELALRQVAEQVDRSLESYMEQKDIQDPWPVRERIAVCFSSNPRAQYLIARAARMARRMDAELFAIYVDIGQDTSEQDQNFAQRQHSIFGKPGRKSGETEGQGRVLRNRGIRAGETCDASDLRPLGRRGMAEVSVHDGHSPLPARRPGGGRAYRHAGNRLNAVAKRFSLSEFVLQANPQAAPMPLIRAPSLGADIQTASTAFCRTYAPAEPSAQKAERQARIPLGLPGQHASGPSGSNVCVCFQYANGPDT